MSYLYLPKLWLTTLRYCPFLKIHEFTFFTTFSLNNYFIFLSLDSHCDCHANYIHDPDTQLCTTEQCADGHTFCMNGGSCNAAGNGCECPAGVTGDNCQDSELCDSVSQSTQNLIMSSWWPKNNSYEVSIRS